MKISKPASDPGRPGEASTSLSLKGYKTTSGWNRFVDQRFANVSEEFGGFRQKNSSSVLVAGKRL